MGKWGSWSQPICDVCWRQREGDRIPVRIVTRPPERCAFCGDPTTSGIYVRIDPALVLHPRQTLRRLTLSVRWSSAGKADRRA